MNRSTIILILVLVVLGAITYFLLPSEQERETSDEVPEISFAIDSASVFKIEFVRGSKSTVFENVAGKWMMTSPVKYPADPASVFQLLSSLSRFKIGSLISSNPDKQHL